MPINPNIALGFQPPPQADMLGSLAKVLQIKGAMAQQQLIPGQIQGQQLENQTRQQQLSGVEAQNEAYKTAITVGPDGLPTFDKGMITNTLASKGQGHLIPAVLKQFTDMEESAGKVREQKSKLANEEKDYAGTIGAAAESAGYDPDILKAGLTHAAAIYGPDSDSAKALQALQQDPSKAKAFADLLIKGSPKQQQLRTAGTAADARAKAADIAAQRLELERPGIQALNIDRQNTAAGTKPVQPTDQQRIDIEKANSERAAAAQKETQRHNAVEENQGGARLGLERQKLGFDMAGGVSPAAQMAAEGKMDPQTLRGMIRRMPGIISQIKQVDPNFDEANIDNRYNTLKEFSSTSVGKAGGQAIALNTLIHHADLYMQTAEALKNGSFVPGNAIYNKVAQAFGSAPPTNAALVARFFAGETGKVATGGVPAEGEINGILKNLSTNASPDQIAGAGKTLLEIASGRATPLMERVKDAKLENVVHVLGPDAQQILKARGFDPATMKPASAGGGADAPIVQNSPSTGAYRYSTDGGKTWQAGQPPK